MNTELNTLLDDIPRGNSTKRFSEQTAPQSRFINPIDVLNHPPLHFNPENPEGKVLFGAIGDQLIGIGDDRHIVTVAGSRSGKSVALKGNLMFYPGSVIGIDPKGEISEFAHQYRCKLGQRMAIIDPFKIVKGKAAEYRVKFNPMVRLTLDNPYFVEDTLQLIDGLIVSSGQEKDPHWNESAAQLISGLILYVAFSDNFSTEERHLITVRRLLFQLLRTSDKKTYDTQIDVMQSMERLRLRGYADQADIIEDAICSFYDKGKEERGSVLSTAQRHTKLLDLRSMKDVLTGHDIDLEDLKRDAAGLSLFLVLPANRMGQCNRWLRIVLNQFLDAMERETTAIKYPVLACLDEFAVLGHMTVLENAAGQIASYGVRLWVIIQDWSQGKMLYKDRFESFAANAGVLQAFGNVDLTTLDYLSKRLGRTPVQDARMGEVTTEHKKQGMSGKQESRQLYPLLTADEISRYFARSDPLKRQLIFWAGKHPMILQRVEYFDPGSPIAPWCLSE